MEKGREKDKETTYFDLDKRTPPDGTTCRLYSLCKEIAAGCDAGTDNTIEDVYKKLTNKDGSGIIDHLKADLNFDVTKYEDFPKCQFLKLLYRYEKEKTEDNHAFQITKVLKRPRVENIKSPYYGISTLYGNDLKKLQTELERKIGKEAAEERKKLLILRNQRWNNALSNMMKLAYEEEAIKKDNYETSKKELLIIRDFLTENIYQQLEKPLELAPSDTIFMAFYTLLIEHGLLCEAEDRMVSYNLADFYESEEESYVGLFKMWEGHLISDKLQEQILDQLISEGTCPVDICGDGKFVDVKYMIFRKNGELKKEEIGALRLARKYLHVLRDWIRRQKPTDIPEAYLIGSWYLAIIQEVVYCKINHIMVRNDAYGVEEKRRTLTATLKNADRAEAKHIQEWMIRIENRYSADIGGGELQAIFREIEDIFEKIRKWELQYHDLKDFLFVDRVLVHTVERMVVPRFVAICKLEELAAFLHEKIGVIYGVCTNSVGLLNLGRELELNKGLMNQIVVAVKQKKNEFNLSGLDRAGYKVDISIHYANYQEDITYLLMFYLDANGKFFITYFRPVEKDEVIEQYATYGLGRLGVKEN